METFQEKYGGGGSRILDVRSDARKVGDSYLYVDYK